MKPFAPKRPIRLIGIHGKAKSGKDELCKILCATYGFKRRAFADKIKEFAIKYYGLTMAEVTSSKTKQSRMIIQGVGSSVRELISHIHNLFENPEQITFGVSEYPKWVEDIAIKYFYIELKDIKSRKKLVKQILSGTLLMWTEKHIEFFKLTNGKDEQIWVEYLKQTINNKNVYVIADVRYLNEKKYVEFTGGKTIKIFRVDKPLIEHGQSHISETELDLVTAWNYSIVNEHKTNWRDPLVLACSNMVRKFKNLNLFVEEDLEKFNIQLDKYEYLYGDKTN